MFLFIFLLSANNFQIVGFYFCSLISNEIEAKGLNQHDFYHVLLQLFFNYLIELFLYHVVVFKSITKD